MGSKLKETFVDPISRRDFLKKTGKGIMGAASSAAFPGGVGGIMETQAAKEVVREAVPFDQQEMIDLVELIMDRGIRPKGDKYYYLRTKDGQEVRAYAPDDWELYGGFPNTYELETLDADGRVIDSLQFEPDWYGGPEGGEDSQPGRTRYLEDIQYIPDVEGNLDDIEPNYTFEEDYGHYLPDKETLEKYDSLAESVIRTAPSVGSDANKRIERKASEEIRQMEKKKEITTDKKLPVKKEGFNLKGLVKSLSRRLPPARVINVLQLVSQGLDLYEALNKTMGMPSKEEFNQIVKDMQESEFANGGIATIGV